MQGQVCRGISEKEYVLQKCPAGGVHDNGSGDEVSLPSSALRRTTCTHACRYVLYTVTRSFSSTVRLRPVLPSALPASDDVCGAAPRYSSRGTAPQNPWPLSRKPCCDRQ